MKIKTTIRAGQGGADSSTSSGGANSGGVNSNKPVYYPPISRCVGI